MTVTFNIPSQLPALTGNSLLYLRVNLAENGIEWAAAAGGGITINSTAIVSGTVNRILFEGAGNVVQQDAGFVWNNTDKRLILGADQSSVDTNPRLVVVGKNPSGTTTLAAFHNSTGNSNNLVLLDDGRIGIGTATLAADDWVRISRSAGTVFFYGLTIRNEGTGPAAQRFISNQGTGTITQFGGNTPPLLGFNAGAFGLNTNAGRLVLSISINSPIRMYTNNVSTARMSIEGNGNVLIGTETDVASSILTLASTTKGFLPPRNANPAANITSPAEGLIAFNTTNKKLQVYDGTNWIDLH